MSLTDFANVVLSTEGPALTQVGFGTPAVAAYHTEYADLVREYTALSEMVTDGFTSNDPAYKAVQRGFQQSPRPPKIKVLRLATSAVQVVKITPVVVAAAATTYSIKIIGPDGDTGTASFTSDTSPSVAEICATSGSGLGKAINDLAATGVAAVNNTTNITITMAAGAQVYVSDWDPRLLKIEDASTGSTTIDDDLDAVQLVDDDWYGLGLAFNGSDAIAEAAAWAETQVKMFFWNSSDWQIADVSETSDVGSDLQDQSYARTVGVYSQTNTGSYAGIAAMCERFPHDPGAVGAGGTFHGKTLRGVSADGLTPSQKSAVRSKNVMPYITTAGRNHTLDGKTSSGEFADVTRFLDWMVIRTEERIAAAILDNDKIPYTDSGVTIILGQINAQLQLGINVGGLSPDPAPVVTAPKVADIPSNDRKARKLTGIAGSFTLAGAIHLVDPISFTVS
jgi:hypothetical protein